MNTFTKLPLYLQAVVITLVGVLVVLVTPILLLLLVLAAVYGGVLALLWLIEQCKNTDDEP